MHLLYSPTLPKGLAKGKILHLSLFALLSNRQTVLLLTHLLRRLRTLVLMTLLLEPPCCGLKTIRLTIAYLIRVMPSDSSTNTVVRLNGYVTLRNGLLTIGKKEFGNIANTALLISLCLLVLAPTTK